MLERAAVGDRQQACRPRAVLGAEDVGQLRRRPDVERALGALGVGVERRGEPTLGGAELADQEVGDALGGPDPDLGAPLGVDAQQLRVVVEHLLEVRHHPVGVDGVAGEPAAELVVDPAARHRLQRCGGHLPGPVRPAAEEELQDHRRWELGRPSEAAPLGVELPLQRLDRPGEHGFVEGSGREREVALEVVAQVAGHPSYVVTAVVPGVHQRLQDLAERRLTVPRLVGEVGAGEERVGVVVEHARHRPAAVAGHRRGGVHVDGVHVRPLLAVDLDADEVLVEVGRGRLVLEGLVGHHVAPVAGGVPDAEQHRDVAPPGLLERGRLPLPPVDRVVGVLEEVRRRG